MQRRMFWLVGTALSLVAHFVLPFWRHRSHDTDICSEPVVFIAVIGLTAETDGTGFNPDYLQLAAGYIPGFNKLGAA